MILWLGIGVGLVFGLAISKSRGHPYQTPIFNHSWLVFAGFLPQFIAIHLKSTRAAFPDSLAALFLVTSQLALFVFALLNRSIPGMLILIVGLILNLAVMLFNGGFMPISPHTAASLVSEDVANNLIIGNRFGSKDILLPTHETHLELLADRFLSPPNFPYQVAFSLGDVFISFGAFWMLAYQKLTP